MNERLIEWLGRGAAAALIAVGILVGVHLYGSGAPPIKPASVTLSLRADDQHLVKQVALSSPKAAGRLYGAVMAVPAAYSTHAYDCPGKPAKGSVTLSFGFGRGMRRFEARLLPNACPITLRLPGGKVRYGYTKPLERLVAFNARALGTTVQEMSRAMGCPAASGPVSPGSPGGACAGDLSTGGPPKADFPQGGLQPGDRFRWHGAQYVVTSSAANVYRKGLLGTVASGGVRYKVRRDPAGPGSPATISLWPPGAEAGLVARKVVPR